MTVVPLVAESVPAVVVQAALPGACVRLTFSPTPILVRVRAPGVVATVWLVMVSAGAGGVGPGPGGVGPGPGGGGPGPGGVGPGPGGVGPGPGGVGPGPGGVGPGPGGVGVAHSASRLPIVRGPTMPSGCTECALWYFRTADCVSDRKIPSTPNLGSGKPASTSAC